MTPLNSQSTLAEVQAAYLDNADYATAGSVAKCAAFIQACTFLLLPGKFHVSRIKHGERGGNEVEIDPSIIERQLKSAKAWHAAHAGGNRVAHFSFEDWHR